MLHKTHSIRVPMVKIWKHQDTDIFCSLKSILQWKEKENKHNHHLIIIAFVHWSLHYKSLQRDFNYTYHLDLSAQKSQPFHFIFNASFFLKQGDFFPQFSFVLVIDCFQHICHNIKTSKTFSWDVIGREAHPKREIFQKRFRC